MLTSEIKNSHLIKLLFWNQFVNNKFSSIFIIFLSILVTGNDSAVNILWGDAMGYLLAVWVFFVWALIYFSVFALLQFIFYFLNTSLRKGLGTYCYQISENGLVEKSDLGSSITNWNAIVKLHTGKNRTYIERSGDNWGIILRKGNEEEYDNFVAQLQAKIV